MTNSFLKSFLYPSPRINLRKLGKLYEGQTCLVTGATSGIGKSLTKLLMTLRANLVLLGRNEEELNSLCEEAGNLGLNAVAYVVDFRNEEELNRVANDLKSNDYRIDFFFANAGKSIHRSIEQSVDRLHDFDRTMSINYRAHVQLLLALFPKLKKCRGSVVYSNSVSLLYPPAPGWSAYHASKGAMDIWLRTAKVEWEREGIRVRNAYLPLVDTPMSAPNKSYRNLPKYNSDEAAWILLKLAVSPSRSSYMPWWARCTVPLARIFRLPIEWYYRKYYYER